ncbi:hypothetical protein NZK35_30330 [Stieleria sp. ICT_E10.1]|uniref:hypothetical protein n=1 Tax=Stieleria sedimenti TaxID=2976331 RepID=UPI00217FD2D7|nr:hypothetical protein [Stieleria sedimenti]MCS7470974.1 hypothetical protein [Stieleria sedimenti]
MVMDVLSDPAVKAGLALLILIIVSAAAFFLVARLRDYTNGDRDSTSSGLLNFEEMRLKGDISEEEFRTIQAASHRTDEGDAPENRPDAETAPGRND